MTWSRWQWLKCSLGTQSKVTAARLLQAAWGVGTFLEPLRIYVAFPWELTRTGHEKVPPDLAFQQIERDSLVHPRDSNPEPID